MRIIAPWGGFPGVEPRCWPERWKPSQTSPPDCSSKMRCAVKSKLAKLENHRPAPLRTPTDLSAEAIAEVSAALNGLLADTFALYVKTKNFHWHVSGPFFRSYHLLLDEQAESVE